MDRRTHRIYLSASAVLRAGWSAVVTLVLIGLMAPPLPAQPVSDSADAPAEWTLVVDGTEAAWPELEPPPDAMPVDSVRAVARRVVRHYQTQGYYRAHVDSVAVDSARAHVQLYVARGPRIPIGTIRIRGAEALSPEQIRRLMDTRAGETLDPATLEADLEAIVARYEEAGYPLAQVRIEETTLTSGTPPTLRLTLSIDEGRALWLEAISVPEEARTAPSFLAQIAELEIGQPLTAYDPAAIRRRVEATRLFRNVGEPELRITDDGGAVLHLPITERAPGAFDLVLGYLPPQGRGEGGQIVGNGQLSLRNLFGGGRTMSLELDRRPGQVSQVDVRATDPYLLGWPLRLDLRFAGEQRDSTYGKQAYHLGAGYRFAGGLELAGTITREVTRPGQAGTRLQGGEQRIARATAWFAGLSIRYQNVDRPVNPRQGFVLETSLEQGRKSTAGRVVTAEQDTVRERSSLRQERLRFEARAFAPTWAQQVVALGLDAALLRSSRYDRSDLFRIGGANTLRGYDEDRFLGRAVGRLFLEYRYQVDRASYAYVFGDLGMVETPDLRDLEGARTWHPGYGLGVQVSTRLGLVNASYALSPEDASPAEGRIHLGLSVGL